MIALGQANAAGGGATSPGTDTASSWRDRRDVARVVLLVAGLAAVVAVRWTAQVELPGGGLAIGAGFGAALFVIAALGAPSPAAGRARGRPAVLRGVAVLVAGVASGLVLVALAATIRADLLPPLRPAVPFVPWVAVTILVATAEEAVLRGTLFSALERIAGPFAAVAVTSVLFSLMHVPFYGAAALPLDLAVGIVFGGLRLATGGVAAPAAAHVTADLATWWL